MGELRGVRGRLRAAALLAALLLLDTGSADATIYKCTTKGRVSFRDVPCAAREKQTRLGQGELAGCYEIRDISEWDGGAGRWIVRIAADGERYDLRDYFSPDKPADRPADVESVPMRRATLGEMDAVAQKYRLKVTSGFVLDVPGISGMGLFQTWNHDGVLQMVGLFAFANGQAERVSCP